MYGRRFGSHSQPHLSGRIKYEYPEDSTILNNGQRFMYEISLRCGSAHQETKRSGSKNCDQLPNCRLAAATDLRSMISQKLGPSDMPQAN